MTFLPIVDRELRVAARKRSTFWMRIIAALVALVIGSGFLILATVGWGFGTVNLGKGLFATLTWLGLAAALSTGLFFTSDCLSEEKREGTLGFLFLTDLSGYDVVFGKLLATSLRGFYALLAVFPVLAITLLLGGVTGAQFWKTALALVNALFASLAAGLFVSAISRDSQRALAGTLLLLFVWVAAGPAMDGTFAAVKQRTFSPIVSLSSPGYLFVMAGAWGKTPFWHAFLINQALAWTFLGLACVLLPRTWQERAATGNGNWVHWWKFGGVNRRLMLRRRLIANNPVVWLIRRKRWQSLALWLFAIVLAAALAGIFASDKMGWIIWSYFGGLFTLGLYLSFALQSGRFFVEARRTGLLELMLATPLTGKQIVQGQWRALLRLFGPPVALYLAVHLIGSALGQQMMFSRLAAAAPPAMPAPTTVTNSTGVTVITNTTVVTTTTVTGITTTVSVGSFLESSGLVSMVMAFAEALKIAANLIALSWFGMWMGITSKNNHLATLKTLLFVQIIPWFVASFASLMIVPLMLWPTLMRRTSTMPTSWMTWFPVLTSAVIIVLYLIKDVAFVMWSRQKLYSDFREQAMQSAGPDQSALPEPLPQANVPPVIAPG